MNRKYDFRVTEDDCRKEQLKSWKQGETKLPPSILMPPPNITGSLHLGHTLNLVIQDFIIRSFMTRDESIYWISGFDHAGIAMQSVLENSGVVARKNTVEKIKFALSEWYPQKRQKFIEQWKNLGLQLDYQQDNFTMDNHVQDKTKDYFVSLYRDGLIYRGTRMVNWDPKLETVISDIETNSEEIESILFYINYPFPEGGKITVATSRPETIFADVALFVNPNDDRYFNCIGKFAINPLTGQQIPVLADKRILIEFGTGVLKCTPAHDFKDYEIAKEKRLPVNPCYGKEGILNKTAGSWEGRNFKTVSDEIINYLRRRNFFVKQEKYWTRRIFSQRSGATIEPLISLQWFLDLPLMIKRIEDKNPNFLGEMKFLPSEVRKKLEDWKVNTREWCISRQLWWGHQIPAWYNSEKEIFVGIKQPTGQWVRDENVLDTWFSSSLWPLITTVKNGKFVPLEYLVTGSDLLFFWLFKMITFAFYFHQKAPFLKVVIHGLIRDENGKKMSKSQGNGIEQETITASYGVDSLRLFLLSNNVVGNDIIFNFSKLKGCYFFLQKLWSISEFITKNSPEKFRRAICAQELNSFIQEEGSLLSRLVEDYLLSKLSQIEKNYRDQLEREIDTSRIVLDLLNFTKEEVSNYFIPLLKGIESDSSYAVLNYSFQQLLILLSPSIPFISSYLYLKHTSNELALAKLDSNHYLRRNFSTKNFILLELPFMLRKSVGLLCKDSKVGISSVSLGLDLLNEWLSCTNLVNQMLEQLRKNEGIDITLLNDKQGKFVSDGAVEVTPFGLLRFSVTRKKYLGLEKSLESNEFYEREIERSKNLLNNTGFVQKAPRELVNLEREKLASYYQQQQKLLKRRNV